MAKRFKSVTSSGGDQKSYRPVNTLGSEEERGTSTARLHQQSFLVRATRNDAPEDLGSQRSCGISEGSLFFQLIHCFPEGAACPCAAN